MKASNVLPLLMNKAALQGFKTMYVTFKLKILKSIQVDYLQVDYFKLTAI